MSIFLILIIALGWVISWYAGNAIILYVAVGLSLMMNIFAYWKSDSIALAMSGAKAVKREEAEYIYRRIENLCITAGLPMPRVYTIDSSQINAFATGRNPEHSAIAISTGAIQKLENEELEGVLAHELSHIGNRDILVSTVAVVLAGVIAIVSDIFFRMTFWGGRDNDKAGAIKLVVVIVAAILAPIAATLIRLSVSRQREYLADASGALLTRYPDGLASALEKIEQDSQPMKQAKNATAHLFLANPFGEDQRNNKHKEHNWFTKLFMTHPPIHDRVKRLRDLKI